MLNHKFDVYAEHNYAFIITDIKVEIADAEIKQEPIENNVKEYDKEHNKFNEVSKNTTVKQELEEVDPLAIVTNKEYEPSSSVVSERVHPRTIEGLFKCEFCNYRTYFAPDLQQHSFCHQNHNQLSSENSRKVCSPTFTGFPSRSTSSGLQSAIEFLENSLEKLQKDNRIHKLKGSTGSRRAIKKSRCPCCAIGVVHVPKYFDERTGKFKQRIMGRSRPKKTKTRPVKPNNEDQQKPTDKTQEIPKQPIPTKAVKVRKVKSRTRRAPKIKAETDSDSDFDRPLRPQPKRMKTESDNVTETKKDKLTDWPTFLQSLEVYQRVIKRLHDDDITDAIPGDVLMCLFGESQLRRHRGTKKEDRLVAYQLRLVARVFITLKQSVDIERLLDALKPELFENFVQAAKTAVGHESPLLFKQIGSRIIRVCEVATELLNNENRFLSCADRNGTLRRVKRLRELIQNTWELKKTGTRRLVREVTRFRNFVLAEIDESVECIRKNENVVENYRQIGECVMALTILINEKRSADVPPIILKDYAKTEPEPEPSSDILTRDYKRVRSTNTRDEPIQVLFPKSMQSFIEVMLSVRAMCLPDFNPYLFGSPTKPRGKFFSNTRVFKRLAFGSGVSDTTLFTSVKQAERIATIMRVLEAGESQREELGRFMGHPESYRAPYDDDRLIKICKVLDAVNEGRGAEYMGKSLDDVELSEDEEEDVPECKDKAEPADMPDNASMARDDAKSLRSGIKEAPVVPKEPVKTKREWKPWTDREAAAIYSFFKGHIQQKRAPKQYEIEILQEKKPFLEDRSWMKIKAFVYNCYRKT